MSHRLGCIASGKLYLKNDSGSETEIGSDFVRDLKRRLESIEDRASFREGGSGAQFMRGNMPAASRVADTFHAEFSCGAFSEDKDNICYAVDAADVRGLFIYEPGEKYERRVFHGPKHRFTSISVRGTGEDTEWLVGAAQDHGASCIGLFRPEQGGGIRELTEGDSLDSYPVWVPGSERRFTYQTCGLARNRDGEWLGLGPASLQRVDLGTGSMESVVEDDRFDFLCPAYAPDGTLYYLKRPYEPMHRASIKDVALDALLFPFRLVRAVLAFLNVFSVMFSGKPLQTAGAPPRRGGHDPKAVFLYGRWVNMEKQMREAAQDELASVVPKNWELVRMAPDGAAKTIASAVIAFAVARDGTLYFSNGRGIFRMPGEGGKPVKVSDRKLVTALFAD
jgi:hypothetical protein